MKQLLAKLLSRFRDRNKPDLKFFPLPGYRLDIGTPVKSAKAFKADWLRKQYQNPPLKFATCPGMWDYMQAGYIIPAWCDMHIKINEYGVSVRLEGPNHKPGHHEPGPMDFELVEGLAPITETGHKGVTKVSMPWGIMAKPGISAQVLPCIMHSDFLDKIFVYPGVVDYDKFFTINFIFSGLKECEFTIWAGTPLLQVIPFKRQEFNAECGPPTEREGAMKLYSFFSRRPGFYRRLFHGIKKYNMTIKDDE